MNRTIYSAYHKYIVEKLKKARINSGLSQKEVGKLLGRSQSYVSKIESGQHRIDVVCLKDFARVYKKDISYFIK